jgi:crotonobetainyl-CoA:carnitine CoA-transferase CaiB-like acyl-CoA transferase
MSSQPALCENPCETCVKEGLPRGAAPPRAAAGSALREQRARVAHRDFVDGVVAEVFGGEASGAIVDRLTEAQTAFGNVNSVYDLIEHPQLRTRRMNVHGRSVEVPASPWSVEWEGAEFAEAPALDAQGAAIRAELAAATQAGSAPRAADAAAR